MYPWISSSFKTRMNENRDCIARYNLNKASKTGCLRTLQMCFSSIRVTNADDWSYKRGRLEIKTQSIFKDWLIVYITNVLLKYRPCLKRGWMRTAIVSPVIILNKSSKQLQRPVAYAHYKCASRASSLQTRTIGVNKSIHSTIVQVIK